MDFDLNAALHDYRSDIYALEVYQKPSAASTPPPTRPADVALTDSPANRPTTYNDLPPEVILRIGSHVPIQDVGSFGAVNSRTYHLMKDRRTVWRFWRRAERAVSLSAMNTIIWDFSGLIEDPEQRVEPIEMLRQRLMTLPREERVEAFERLYFAADAVPKEGAQIQRAMMAMLGDFPLSERTLLFRYLSAMVERRSPEQENLWPDLALQLLSFPLTSPKILEGYKFILARMPSLPESQQAELIPVLADLLFQLLDKYGDANTLVPQLYAELRDRALRLSMPYQGAPIGALAAVVSALPESERSVRNAEMRKVLKRRGIDLTQVPNAKRDLAVSKILSYMKYNRFSEQGRIRILKNLGYSEAFDEA